MHKNVQGHVHGHVHGKEKRLSYDSQKTEDKKWGNKKVSTLYKKKVPNVFSNNNINNDNNSSINVNVNSDSTLSVSGYEQKKNMDEIFKKQETNNSLCLKKYNDNSNIISILDDSSVDSGNLWVPTIENKSKNVAEKKKKYQKGSYKKGNYKKRNYEKGNYEKGNYEKGNYEKRNYEKENYEKENYEKENYEKENYEEEGYKEEGYKEEGYKEKDYEQDKYEQEKNKRKNNKKKGNKKKSVERKEQKVGGEKNNVDKNKLHKKKMIKQRYYEKKTSTTVYFEDINTSHITTGDEYNHITTSVKNDKELNSVDLNQRHSSKYELRAKRKVSYVLPSMNKKFRRDSKKKIFDPFLYNSSWTLKGK
ncbi:conserved protein, unknown function [Hepatocystis sp. ex Piliocolobus tephrosceles]|nr:conserved protein, unknown function [Hepatocystis sp. ex Piliocolobus tephrosceles]